jgi:hypothetical protein
MHGRDVKCSQGFGGKAIMKGTTRKPRCRWRIILKYVLEK